MQQDDNPHARKTSGLAIASMVLGIVSLLGGFALIAPTLLALIFGHIAMSSCRKDSRLGGLGMAIAGIVTGYISLVFLISILISMAIPAYQKVRDSSHEKTSQKSAATRTEDPRHTDAAPQPARPVASGAGNQAREELVRKLTQSVRANRTRFVYDDQRRVLEVDFTFLNIGQRRIESISGIILYTGPGGRFVDSREFEVREGIAPQSSYVLKQEVRGLSYAGTLREVDADYIISKIKLAGD